MADVRSKTGASFSSSSARLCIRVSLRVSVPVFQPERPPVFLLYNSPAQENRSAPFARPLVHGREKRRESCPVPDPAEYNKHENNNNNNINEDEERLGSGKSGGATWHEGPRAYAGRRSSPLSAVIYHGRRRRAGGNFVPTSPLAARIAIQPARYNFIIPAK